MWRSGRGWGGGEYGLWGGSGEGQVVKEGGGDSYILKIAD